MASISNAELMITTDRPQDRATIVVSCDVQFTEVEVNAMNLLGLEYTLHCQVLNKEVLDEDPVVSFHHTTFPREPAGPATMNKRHSRPTCRWTTCMSA